MTREVETGKEQTAPERRDRSAWRDQRRLDELHREHSDQLVALLTARTGDRDLAQDLAQETLLRAADHLDQLDPDLPAWPWLKTVAMNLITDHHRKHRREQLTDDLSIHHQSQGHDPITITLDREMLTDALSELPDRQRLAIELRYLEQWKAGEACDLFGLTRTSFEQLLFRARTNLRDAYENLTEHTGRLAGVLLPLHRFRSTAVAHVKARVAGWDLSLHAMGAAALDAVGQAAAAFAVLGLAAAAAATGASTGPADLATTFPSSLSSFFDFEPIPPAQPSSVRRRLPPPVVEHDRDVAPTTRRHVELQAPTNEKARNPAVIDGHADTEEDADGIRVQVSVEVGAGRVVVESVSEVAIPCAPESIVLSASCAVARSALDELPGRARRDEPGGAPSRG